MTDMPPMPNVPPAPPAKPKRARSTNAIILGSAAAVIAAVIGTGIFVVQAMNDDNDRPASTSSSSRAAEESEPVVEDETEEPDLDLDLYVTELTAADFEIELRTKSRQCFGSAGCNLVVEPELTYSGDTSELDPDLTYEVTYEITGDESGPILQTAEVTDQTTVTFDTTVVSTSSRGTELSAEVTDVTTSEW